MDPEPAQSPSGRATRQRNLGKRRRAGATLALVLMSLEVASTGCDGMSRSSAPHAATDDAGRGTAGNASPTAGATASSGGTSSGGTSSGGTSSGANAAGAAAGGGASGVGGERNSGGTPGGGGVPSAADGGSAGNDAANAGNGFTQSGTGGDAATETGGESGAGAGGSPECQDLCTDAAPACCTTALHCVTAEWHCRIDVTADIIDLPHDYATLEQDIAALPGDLAVSISDLDVKAAAVSAPTASRFEFDLNETASTAYGDALMSAFGHGFQLFCNDQPLFAGMIWFEDGQAVLDYPIISVAQAKDGVILELGAFEGAWTTSYADDGTDADRARLDRPELRAAFCARGILTELD